MYVRDISSKAIVLAAVAAAAGLCLAAGSALCMDAAVKEGKARDKAGWLESGRTIWLLDAGPRLKPLPEGVTRHFSPSRELRALACSEDTVWIGTEGGLYSWSVSNDSLSREGGPCFTAVTALAFDDRRSLWVGGEHGVSVRRGGRWVHYVQEVHPFFSRVTGFFPADERMWISTYGNGCGYVFSDSLTILTRADSLLDDRVLSVIEMSGEELWFGTASGLCRADSFRWQSLRYGNRIPIGEIDDMLLDEEGNLFVAVARRGTALYNMGRVRVFGERQGLASNEIHAFSLDPKGNVWAAGKAGVSMYDGSGWVPYRVPEIPFGGYDFLSASHDIEGNMYLGTDSGRLLAISRDAVRIVDIPQDFPSAMVPVIRSQQGAIWFLSDSSLYRLEGGLTEIPLPDRWFQGQLTGFELDRSGGIWISTRFGILHYDWRKWEVFDKRLGLPTEYITCVTRGSGDDLWFGTFDKGVLRLAADRWVHYTSRDGLPSDRIASMACGGEGAVWVLTAGGLAARFVSGKWEAVGLPVTSERPGEQDASDTLSALDPGIRLMRGYGGPGREAYGTPGISLSAGPDGRCVVARDDGIFIDSQSGWEYIALPAVPSRVLPLSVMRSRSGEIWLGTQGNGLFVRRGNRWIEVTANEGLTDDRILTMCEDEEGRVWLGTRTGGVTLYRRD